MFLLHNQGGGKFVEESASVGLVLGSLELGDDAGNHAILGHILSGFESFLSRFDAEL